MRLLLGDCLEKLKELDDNSIDSIVTDPPYGLSFMGKKWDYDVPTQDVWEECMRVLKPGGHLLAFAGSRTYHRMAVRIEDAGFEIRDQIMWLYGSGFPKSLNIGKAIDKKNGVQGDVIGTRKVTSSDIGQKSGWNNLNTDRGVYEYREIMNEYVGWGTALKPAHEPIVMARKPLSEKTVVDNVLKWGTGGINIDDSRIGLSGGTSRGEQGEREKDKKQGFRKNRIINEIDKGRFPANIILDKEAGKILDEQSGELKTGHIPNNLKGWGKGSLYDGKRTNGKEFQQISYNDASGGASRFFYCPKTSKTDRNEGVDGNVHPTVKPTDLMLYLIRMVTPKGGTTLDPFMGSGSTGKAAVRGGFDFVGIEMDEEYMKIAQARIQYEQDNPYNEEKGERIKINKNANKFW